MGYTVYLIPSEKEETLLKEVFSEEWLESLGTHWEFSWPQFSYDALSYVADQHKTDLLFGLDYGDHYMATAVVATVAQLLGRDEYFYDSEPEVHKPSQFFWWRQPKKDRKWSIHRKMTYQCSRHYFKQVDALCNLIHERFEAISNQPITKTKTP